MNGERCVKDFDCCSGYCNSFRSCGKGIYISKKIFTKFMLILLCYKVADGLSCFNDNDCLSGICNTGLLNKCGLG